MNTLCRAHVRSARFSSSVKSTEEEVITVLIRPRRSRSAGKKVSSCRNTQAKQWLFSLALVGDLFVSRFGQMLPRWSAGVGINAFADSLRATVIAVLDVAYPAPRGNACVNEQLNVLTRGLEHYWVDTFFAHVDAMEVDANYPGLDAWLDTHLESRRVKTTAVCAQSSATRAIQKALKLADNAAEQYEQSPPASPVPTPMDCTTSPPYSMLYTSADAGQSSVYAPASPLPEETRYDEMEASVSYVLSAAAMPPTATTTTTMEEVEAEVERAANNYNNYANENVVFGYDILEEFKSMNDATNASMDDFSLLRAASPTLVPVATAPLSTGKPVPYYFSMASENLDPIFSSSVRTSSLY